MSKFKKGDIIVGNKRANNRYAVTREGWKGTVTRVLSNGEIEATGNGAFFLRGPYRLQPAYFDLVTENKKVVITTDGKTTLARLYENNKVVKSAKAECSPDDKFDFEKGATIAYNRLIENPAETKKPKLYNGKVICVNPRQNAESYTKGKIYEIEDGLLTTDKGNKLPRTAEIHTFEELQEWSTAEWLEVVE